jgi:rod shape-determining protein MreD
MVLVLVHWSVVAQHRFFVGKGFALVWSVFGVVAPLAIALTAMLSLLAARVAPDPAIVLVQALLTIALYPPVAWLLGRAQRLFLAGL